MYASATAAATTNVLSNAAEVTQSAATASTAEVVVKDSLAKRSTEAAHPKQQCQ